MNTLINKPSKNKSNFVASSLPESKKGNISTFQFVDNRPKSIAQRKVAAINNSYSTYQLVDNRTRIKKNLTPKVISNNLVDNRLDTIQKKDNGNSVIQRITNDEIKDLQASYQGSYKVEEILKEYAKIAKVKIEDVSIEKAKSLLLNFKSYTPADIPKATKELTGVGHEGGRTFLTTMDHNKDPESSDFAMSDFGLFISDDGTQWHFTSSYRYLGSPYASEVSYHQIVRNIRTYGTGSKPVTVVRRHVVNDETREKIDSLKDRSEELKTTFLTDTPNGKHTQRVLDLFGLQAKEVWKEGSDVHISIISIPSVDGRPPERGGGGSGEL